MSAKKRIRSPKSKPSVIRHSAKKGMPPGSLVYIGKKHEHIPNIEVIRFDAENFERKRIHEPDQLNQLADLDSGNALICLHGIHQPELVRQLGDKYHLDALILEDILNTDHRPKIEERDDYIFMTLKYLKFDRFQTEMTSEQISLVLGRSYVLLFQENSSGLFNPLIERIQSGGGKIRTKGHDYLFYAIIDMVVDNYYEIIEAIGQNLDELEEDLYANPDQNKMEIIQNHKKALMTMRRSVYPLREAIGELVRDELDLIKTENEKYFKDIYDHTFHFTESIDSLIELNNGMKDLYVSSISLKMNQVMQVLTIYTVIFAPLTFIAGIYGMNFEHMPELQWHNGYYLTLAMMGLTGLGLLIYFKRKRWL